MKLHKTVKKTLIFLLFSLTRFWIYWNFTLLISPFSSQLSRFSLKKKKCSKKFSNPLKLHAFSPHLYVVSFDLHEFQELDVWSRCVWTAIEEENLHENELILCCSEFLMCRTDMAVKWCWVWKFNMCYSNDDG